MEKLRRDSLPKGIIIGIIIPAFLFGLLFTAFYLIKTQTSISTNIVTIQKLLLLSILPNIFLLRYTLLKLKHDLTGRGIVLATFLYAVIFAILEFML